MNTNKDHVLYIDDERENLIGFKYVFKKHYSVHIASTAEEGWEILENYEIKVVISDQRMPKTTGVQILEKAAIKYPMTCRIILTGYTDVQDIIQAINKGQIYQYIKKPWDKEEVKVIIDNAINQYDLKKQNKQLIDTLKEKNLELKNINYNLENTVEERTRKIESQNKELESHRNNLEELVIQRTSELKAAKEKAEESDRLKTSFLANVSHEIRTPMNAIIGFSELLLSGDYDNDEKEEFKKSIYVNSETLLRLIDDILDISKIEANQITITPAEHDLNQIMDELYYLFNDHKKVMDKSNLGFFVEKENPEGLPIYIDKIRLHQILSNLLSNALKFTDEGMVTFGYEIVKNENNIQSIRFFTKDTGIGISEESRKHIFDRFRKADTEKNRLFRGTGLGLYISKSLVEKFGGTIWCEQREKGGSSFYFEVPYITYNPKTEPNIPLRKNIEEKINTEFEGKTILVAEDEESSYYYIEKLLRDTKANIFWAKTGIECLEILKKVNTIDLILMDIQMPEMDGHQAIQEIRKINGEVPIVAQTAFAFANQLNEILSSGFNDILPKPFKANDFYKITSKYLFLNTISS